LENKKHICKYCGKEFETSQKLGGHVSRCKLNPNIKDLYNKIGKAKHNTAAFKEYTLICEYCGKEYKLILSENSFNKGKYKKTCSTTCAHKLTIKNCDNISRKLNISNTIHNLIKSNNTGNKIKICEYCGKEFTNLDNNSKQYCSNECMIKGRSKKLSESAKRNKFGGLNPNTTHKNYKRGYYNNIWCDSSWELAFVVYCFEHNISIKRNTSYKEYSFENKIYKFYPDFIINNNELVEIKGFITPKNKAKIEQVHDVTFIFKTEIQPYLKYVINKYGNNFYNLLYDK
jgi:uncharacterized Zn-finger protein